MVEFSGCAVPVAQSAADGDRTNHFSSLRYGKRSPVKAIALLTTACCWSEAKLRFDRPKVSRQHFTVQRLIKTDATKSSTSSTSTCTCSQQPREKPWQMWTSKLRGLIRLIKTLTRKSPQTIHSSLDLTFSHIN